MNPHNIQHIILIFLESVDVYAECVFVCVRIYAGGFGSEGYHKIPEAL